MTVAFCVGTGRCGTTFITELLGREAEVAASHERLRLAACYHMFTKWHGIPSDAEGFLADREVAVANDLASHGISFEASALLSHSIAELHDRFDAHFLLLTRRPDACVASFAVRGSVSELLGTSQVNMTVWGIDVLISKAFGIGGTARIEPYFGWNVLFINARSGVIDATPTCDAYAQHLLTPNDPAPSGCTAPNAAANNGTWNDLDSNFTFASQDVITRYRWSVGAKLKLSVLFLTVEGDLIQGGTSHDSNADVVDNSGSQESFSLSAGLDF